MNIREEQPGDETGIRRVNLAAFETSTEADRVDALRGDHAPIISVVAEEDGNIVGHILFSPATPWLTKTLADGACSDGRHTAETACRNRFAPRC